MLEDEIRQGPATSQVVLGHQLGQLSVGGVAGEPLQRYPRHLGHPAELDQPSPHRVVAVELVGTQRQDDRHRSVRRFLARKLIRSSVDLSAHCTSSMSQATGRSVESRTTSVSNHSNNRACPLLLSSFSSVVWRPWSSWSTYSKGRKSMNAGGHCRTSSAQASGVKVAQEVAQRCHHGREGHRLPFDREAVTDERVQSTDWRTWVTSVVLPMPSSPDDGNLTVPVGRGEETERTRSLSRPRP